MTSLNATLMLSQYCGYQQPKWPHYHKIYDQKWKVYEKNNISLVWEVDIKIRPSRSQSGIKSLVMPDSDPQDGFSYLGPTPHTHDRSLYFWRHKQTGTAHINQASTKSDQGIPCL